MTALFEYEKVVARSGLSEEVIAQLRLKIQRRRHDVRRAIDDARLKEDELGAVALWRDIVAGVAVPDAVATRVVEGAWPYWDAALRGIYDGSLERMLVEHAGGDRALADALRAAFHQAAYRDMRSNGVVWTAGLGERFDCAAAVEEAISPGGEASSMGEDREELRSLAREYLERSEAPLRAMLQEGARDAIRGISLSNSPLGLGDRDRRIRRTLERHRRVWSLSDETIERAASIIESKCGAVEGVRWRMRMFRDSVPSFGTTPLVLERALDWAAAHSGDALDEQAIVRELRRGSAAAMRLLAERRRYWVHTMPFGPDRDRAVELLERSVDSYEAALGAGIRAIRGLLACEATRAAFDRVNFLASLESDWEMLRLSSGIESSRVDR